LREVVRTKEAPQPIGPFFASDQNTRFCLCGSQIALDPATHKLVEGDMKAQTERALRNLVAILAEAGSSRERVVRTTVFWKNISDFPARNEVYGHFFQGSRSTAGVVRCPAMRLLESM
jgi:2-iminobutanoate/2-iminopropanoate deaminase